MQNYPILEYAVGTEMMPCRPTDPLSTSFCVIVALKTYYI